LSSLSHAVQEAESERQANRSRGGWRWKRKSVKLKLKINNGEKWKERVCEKEMERGKEEWVDGKGGGKVLVKQPSFLLCIKIDI